MTTLRQKYEEEMKKRIRTVKTTAADKDNALANAPVLSTVDDRDFSSRRPPQPSQTAGTAVAAKVIKEPKTIDELNQHRDLAIALLSVGALRPGLFLLTKHPWLSSRYPQLADILLNHLELSINPVYAPLSPAVKDPESAAAYAAPLKRPGSDKGSQIKPTTTFPVPPPTKDTQLAFFFPQYAERIPVCSSVDDFPYVVGPMLCIIGAHGYRHLPVFIKLCRIGRASRQDQVLSTNIFLFSQLNICSERMRTRPNSGQTPYEYIFYRCCLWQETILCLV
jgi:THO complex subunit 2